MVMLSEEAAQTPFEIVQRKTLFPTESPEMFVLARFALLKVPVPAITLQIPPIVAVAERVVELAQIVWSVPALGESGLS